MPNQMVPTFPSTIGNVGPHYSTIINASASKNINLDDVFESYRLAQTKLAPHLNKVNLEILNHHSQIILIGWNLIDSRKIWLMW
jgi:hypothetical protein